MSKKTWKFEDRILLFGRIKIVSFNFSWGEGFFICYASKKGIANWTIESISWFAFQLNSLENAMCTFICHTDFYC